MQQMTWDDKSTKHWKRVANPKVNLLPHEREHRDSLRFARGVLYGIGASYLLWLVIAVAVAIALD